jgi:hypothetical protein
MAANCQRSEEHGQHERAVLEEHGLTDAHLGEVVSIVSVNQPAGSMFAANDRSIESLVSMGRRYLAPVRTPVRRAASNPGERDAIQSRPYPDGSAR